MKWRLAQFSAVVVGQSHNPTILNPDFLATEGIVPKSWGWQLAETVTTPPLAVVRYQNDVTITVEQTKMQITDPNVEDGPEQSKITEIATAYVRILPHVRYTAVGNNYQALAPMAAPGEYLMDRFLKKGAWTTSPSMLDAIGIKLSYPLEPRGRVNFSLEAAEAKLPDKADVQQVIVVSGNFSRECAEYPAVNTVVAHLQEAAKDWQAFRHALTLICDIEAPE